MSKKTTILSILIPATILILGGLYLIFDTGNIASNPEGTIGNTAGNLYNDGLFCESDGNIYFANSYDDGCMYVMDLAETTCEKLSSSSARQILAGGNYLYYSQLPVDETTQNPIYSTVNGFVRMKKNGTNITRFHDNYIFYMQLINDTIYYLSSTNEGPEFYKITTSHKDNLLLSSTSINPACVYQDTIYYNDISATHNLYALDTTTDVSSQYVALNMWYPIIEGNYIYYLDVDNNYKLCRYDMTANTRETLTNDRVDCYNLSNGFLYYQKNSTTEPALKRMAYDGSNVVELMTGNYTNINVTSTYIYWTEFADTVTTYRTSSLGDDAIETFSFALEHVE